MSSRELLEVEDEEARRDRLQSILESVDARVSQPMPPPPVPPFPLGQQPTLPLPPPTDLLNRVQAFLPQFAASNAALAQQDPGAINMENIDPTQDQIIQMRLGLGVYEERARRGSPSSSSSSSSSSTSSASDSDSSDSSSDEDSDSDEDLDPISAFLMASRPARPLPRRAGPPAVSVLSSSTSASSTSVTTMDSTTSDSSLAATDVTGSLR